jgi:hypothetical protein
MQTNSIVPGQRFGQLVTVSLSELRPVGAKGMKRRQWLCLCDCGREAYVNGFNLASNHTKSCGCIARPKPKNPAVRHGKSKTAEYRIWYHILTRCYNPNDISYELYGGRGIGVCPAWRESFEQFFADMGERPSKHHSIDRIDNAKDYSPNNCRWATLEQQARNKRNARLITANGETMHLCDWAARLGVHASTIVQRIKHGWTEEKAVTTPGAWRGRNISGR